MVLAFVISSFFWLPIRYRHICQAAIKTVLDDIIIILKVTSEQVRDLTAEKKGMVLVTVCYSRTLYDEKGAFLPIIKF